ncbi:hypothetical protein DL96DRAFT_1627953 [Flagelloscypha sp. PMI_526]|nr:hypothetical protein DL96DRAFT_1627953 [Flagelloscypha sp. PMI_526]
MSNAVICLQCFRLSTRILTCHHCDHSVPLVSKFIPDISLSRRSNSGLSSDADLAQLRQGLSEAKRLLSTYNFLLDTLGKSYGEIHKLVEYYQACQRVGIKKLPPEVLAYIFCCTTADVENPVFRHTSNSSSSMVISFVCSSWRDISLHTPSMWNNISFDSVPGFRLDPDGNKTRQLITRWGPENMEARVETLNLYLQRSKPALLDVKFVAQCGVRDAKFLSQPLISHVERIRSLELVSVWAGAIPAFRKRLHNLLHLRLNGPWLPKDLAVLGLDQPQAVLALRYLSFGCLPQSITISPLPITSLHILDIPIIDLASTTLWTRTDSLLSIFDVPALQTLELKAPSMVHPDVAIEDEIHPKHSFDPYHLATFCHKSSLCTSLTLENIVIGPTSLLNALQELSSLQTLKLRGNLFYRTSLGNRLFSALSERLPSGDLALLPSFLHFDIETPLDKLDGEAFIAFLRTRLFGPNQPGRLSQANIFFLYLTLPPEVITHLDCIALELKHQGRRQNLVVRHRIYFMFPSSLDKSKTTAIRRAI